MRNCRRAGSGKADGGLIDRTLSNVTLHVSTHAVGDRAMQVDAAPGLGLERHQGGPRVNESASGSFRG